MRRNTVKQRLLAGETVIGTMVQEMRVPAIAQIIKAIGYDFFMLDMEHGSYSLETAADILRVGRLLDLCPLVRVASPEYHLIARPLDQGAMGVMMPRIERRDQVERFIEAMKYPPLGKRGCSSDAPHAEYTFGPLPEFLTANNEDTLAITQIERKVAIDHIDELLSVAGVDVALIGPEDLSVSLGVPGETGHPSVIEAIETVVAAAQRHKIVAGIHMGSVEKLQAWMAKGMRLIMYSSDLGFLMDAGATGLAQLRAPARG
jgi:2-keto-3-deoxy-L-rhamnonate aldolase RhmA